MQVAKSSYNLAIRLSGSVVEALERKSAIRSKFTFAPTRT